jgi:hypothetical protein
MRSMHLSSHIPFAHVVHAMSSLSGGLKIREFTSRSVQGRHNTTHNRAMSIAGSLGAYGSGYGLDMQGGGFTRGRSPKSASHCSAKTRASPDQL